MNLSLYEIVAKHASVLLRSTISRDGKDHNFLKSRKKLLPVDLGRKVEILLDMCHNKITVKDWFGDNFQI